jgi:hypothetical protein
MVPSLTIVYLVCSATLLDLTHQYSSSGVLQVQVVQGPKEMSKPVVRQDTERLALSEAAQVASL